MDNRSKRLMMLTLALFVFLLAEAATFYAYSVLWLAEGQPKHHGDPVLKALAWVCLGGMALEACALMFTVARIYKRLP